MAEDIQMQAHPQEKEATIFALPRNPWSGFLDFIRERGVAGFAIGFILGGAAQRLVQALMDDLINPLIGSFLGPAKSLSEYAIGPFKWGDFTSVTINFLILCFVIYIIFKLLHLEKLDKPKE
jgi:large conductance mechanosensitive channel